MQLQVFVSYARNDDEPPLGSEEKHSGFVTTLHKNIEKALRQLGPPAPVLWRDTRNIGEADQFDPELRQNVETSELLLVVLSNNWLDRPWCRKELELFAKRWVHEGDDGIRRRVIVVAKQDIDPSARPPLLQGQTGFRFFARDEDEPGGVVDFYGRHGARDEFYDVVEKLAKDLRARTLRMRSSFAHAADAFATEAPRTATAPLQTIYLAKTPSDMQPVYRRLAEELRKRGYALAPPEDAEIPAESGERGTPVDFVDAALAGAVVSIHLLGEKVGYTPEDSGGDSLVKLQLRRAAARIASSAAGDSDDRTFRRIIWAPKVFVDPAGKGFLDRQPLDVLARFDAQQPSDKVDGSELSSFVDFVVQHLERITRKAERPEPIEPGTRVYVCHKSEDMEYAGELARALKARKIRSIFPAFEGTAQEIQAYHRRNLKECDAVVLCWGRAPDVWVKSQAPNLRDWRKLGRKQKFRLRGLVAGPPGGAGPKKNYIASPPDDEIDVVLDLTGHDVPPPEALDPLVDAARSG
jgi:TIR domain